MQRTTTDLDLGWKKTYKERLQIPSNFNEMFLLPYSLNLVNKPLLETATSWLRDGKKKENSW